MVKNKQFEKSVLNFSFNSAKNCLEKTVPTEQVVLAASTASAETQVANDQKRHKRNVSEFGFVTEAENLKATTSAASRPVAWFASLTKYVENQLAFLKKLTPVFREEIFPAKTDETIWDLSSQTSYLPQDATALLNTVKRYEPSVDYTQKQDMVSTPLSLESVNDRILLADFSIRYIRSFFAKPAKKTVTARLSDSPMVNNGSFLASVSLK